MASPVGSAAGRQGDSSCPLPRVTKRRCSRKPQRSGSRPRGQPRHRSRPSSCQPDPNSGAAWPEQSGRVLRHATRSDPRDVRRTRQPGVADRAEALCGSHTTTASVGGDTAVPITPLLCDWQSASVAEADLAGPQRRRPAPDERDHGAGVVRRPERGVVRARRPAWRWPPRNESGSEPLSGTPGAGRRGHGLVTDL